MTSVVARPLTASIEQSLPLEEADYRFLRDLIHARSGITLGDHKQRLLQGRLQRRLRSLKLDSFAAYCERVRNDPEPEMAALLSAVSTNVTRFFRESHHFDYLAKELLPKWLAAGRTRLRLWSAGCASGEEAYTLAMVLERAVRESGRSVDALILATDLSIEALEAANAGVYRVDELTDVPADLRTRWFMRGTGLHEGEARIRPELREWIRFQRLNLLERWPMQGQFDVIFCRNVVIYFDRDGKRRLFSRFAGQIQSRGYLFLGHSESMAGLSEDFDLIGRSIYQHRPGNMA
ncbi:CheR family methyltransferase [Frateuria aurantia]